jgi:hypothetical protein
VPLATSKHTRSFLQKNGRTYPLAMLDDVELHFTGYGSEEDALENWQRRVTRINWNNLFFKLDASYEEVDAGKIERFLNTSIPNAATACFLSVLEKKKFRHRPIENSIAWIDYWSSDAEILFPFSLNSFNIIAWLNGAAGVGDNSGSITTDFFRPEKEKKDHYFSRFYKRNLSQLDALLYPDAYRISFDEDTGAATIRYSKTGAEHFFLAMREKLFNRPIDSLTISADLSNAAHRHIFLLAKGNPDHVLHIDFVARETDPDDIYSHNHENVRLHLDGLEQEIPAEFEWMHFDYSGINEHTLEAFFTRVNGFCFSINPGSAASGTLQIIAVFAGSVEQFEKIMD